jgi:hypothetical protein
VEGTTATQQQLKAKMGMEGTTAMDGALGAENGANWGDIIAEAV